MLDDKVEQKSKKRTIGALTTEASRAFRARSSNLGTFKRKPVYWWICNVEMKSIGYTS
jgi:hypothetical protein